MNQDANNRKQQPDKYLAGNFIRNILFAIIIVAMFVSGGYSLYLGATQVADTHGFTTDNLYRTAGRSDKDKIISVFGAFSDPDFMFVVLDTSIQGVDPNLEQSVRMASRILADSGLYSSIRIIDPSDTGFSRIVAQNEITHFPAVLEAKKKGGIILIMNDYSEEYLLFAYNSIWGKTSDCSDAKSAIY